MEEPENTYDPEFEDLQREFSDAPFWSLIFVGVIVPVAALIGLAAFLAGSRPHP